MFAEKELLLVPGPTPIPPQVQRAMVRAVINHRSPAYEELFAQLQEKLRRLFAVTGEVFVFPASGTGALEAMVVNFLSPGDPVLMVSIGWFGDRFGEIAERFGAKVTWLKVEWGNAATPASVAEAMDKAPQPFKAVLLTHNETSTAVVNPVRAIAQVVKERGALLLVDAVSGLGAMPLPMDEWQIDDAARHRFGGGAGKRMGGGGTGTNAPLLLGLAIGAGISASPPKSLHTARDLALRVGRCVGPDLCRRVGRRL
jgi:aspartate aminotransferase-like enzyme